MEVLYYGANEVAEMIGVSRGQAYKLIKKMNDELEKQGKR